MSVTETYRPVDGADDDLFTFRLSDILHYLKRSLRFMLLGMVVGGLLGLAYALSKQNQYTADITVMPEIQARSAGGGGLGSLAGLAGLSLDNLGGGSDAIRPDLYPNVLSSVPFALHLLQQPVYAKALGRVMPLQAYMLDRMQHSTGGRIRALLGQKPDLNPALPDPKNYSKALQLTGLQEGLVREIRGRVEGEFDKKTGFIKLTATMPDPVVAATVARQTLEYLTDYITSYRTGKARQQVQFLNQQVAAARRRYESAEYTLSRYRDANRNLFLNTAKIEEQRLQADFLLAQSVYNDLSKQLEQARIKVQEETPVFKMLEPPKVPLVPSAPNRLLIVLAGTIAGAGLGLLAGLLRQFRFRSVA